MKKKLKIIRFMMMRLRVCYKRVFEYATQIALDKQKLSELIEPSCEQITLKFPRSAVLYLRSRKTTPDIFEVNVEIEEQTVLYKIPILKVKNYNVDEIFEKDLIFLIPFHLFALENKFEQYENDETKLSELRSEYEKIADKLNKLFEEKRLEINYLLEISGWTNQVADQLAQRYSKVKEGVSEAMRGKIIRLPETEVYYNGFDAGLEKGLEKGREEGRAEMTAKLEAVELERKRKDKENAALRKEIAMLKKQIKSKGVAH